MTTRLITLALQLGPDRSPPREFRIFSFGENPTSQGTFLFDQDDAEAVMATYREHGVELSIDWEHMAFADPPVPAPAAGWFKPEVRSDGLWATDVRWTPQAEAQLKAGEYRYFSPAMLHNPKTMHVRRLMNLALTNMPASRAQLPLVAATDKPAPGGEETPPMKTLLKMLALAETATEAEAITALNERTARAGELERELLSITGAKSTSEARGLLAAWKQSHETVATLNEKVVKLEAADREREVSALVDQAKRDGKLAPKLEPWARDLGKKDLVALRAYLDNAPKLVATEATGKKGGEVDPNAGAELATLTDEDKKIARDLGLTEAQFLEGKKDLAARRAARRSGQA